MKYIIQLLNHLDQISLMFALIPAGFICALLIFCTFLTQKKIKGMGEWSLGFFLLFISILTIPMIPYFAITERRQIMMLFGNYFFLSGITTLFFGTRKFFGLSYSRQSVYIFLFLPVLIYFFCLFFYPFPRIRLLVVSLWGSYIFFRHSFLFYKFKTKEAKVLDLFGILYTSLLGTIFLFRSIRILTVEKVPENLLVVNPFIHLGSFLGIFSVLGLAILFILVRSSRLEIELNSKMDELLAEIEKRKKIELILSKEASTDALTGIANRRKLFEHADRFFRISKRYSNSFSIIICDIDHFKNVNDRYGHSFGDFIIIEIAKILKLELRKEDILARYGGEEFVILLPETKVKEGYLVAERIRESIEKYQFPQENKFFQITCSFGISSFKKSDDFVLEIIKRADKALYRSKENGRNQVNRF